MESFSKIPDHQKQEFMRTFEEMQMRDSLKMYNGLVERCFDKCIYVGWGGSLNSKKLEEPELKCITTCAEKFMKLTQRVGIRYAEHQNLEGQMPQNPN